jgi:holo-[acyl-carrier protein] synthase
LADRLFYRTEKDLSEQSLAGRFAAKEALAKAVGDPKLLTWNEIEVANNELGKPVFQFHGRTALRMLEHGVDKSWLSISHDAAIAIAMVVLETD